METINHPDHYNIGKYECIKVMREIFGQDAVEHFCLLNSFKYLYRCRFKGAYLEDLKKAKKYLEMLIESREGAVENGD